MKINVIEYTEGMDIVPPVFIANMPNSVYHSHTEGISSSGLKTVLRSPAHYRFRSEAKTSRAMEMGTAIHTALLEPELFKRDYVLLKDVADRRASEYKQAVKVHGSELVLTAPESDKIAGMQEAVLSNSAMAARINGQGWRELSLFVTCPDTGVLVRVRFDLLLADGTIVDLKKTQDARPDAFSRAIDNYGYDLSAALYVDALSWVTGEQHTFEFAVVEEEMPHGHKLYRPCDTTLAEGRRKYREALALFAECDKTGVWHNLACDDVEVISLPSYRLAQIENELEDGGIF